LMDVGGGGRFEPGPGINGTGYFYDTSHGA
jgi:hypothetical protein